MHHTKDVYNINYVLSQWVRTLDSIVQVEQIMTNIEVLIDSAIREHQGEYDVTFMQLQNDTDKSFRLYSAPRNYHA